LHLNLLPRFEMPVEKHAGLKRVEIAALAVRELTCKELGTYCKIYYGGTKRKSKKLRKDSGGEWKPKHPITLNTPGPSDLVIECWKKQRGKLLKKFLGRVAISSSQLDTVDQIKGWYDLGGRGKASEVISGKLYLRAIMPGKPKSLNQHVAEQRARRINVLPAPPQSGIVFDRTHELLGTRAQQKPVLVTVQKQQVTSIVPQQQTSQSNADKEHQLKVDIVSSLNCASEKELAILQQKMKQYDTSNDKAVTRKEIEEIVKGLKDSVQLGMTTLREVGEALNHNWSEHELRIKMQQSNDLLHRFTVIVDELNMAQKQLKEQNIM